MKIKTVLILIKIHNIPFMLCLFKVGIVHISMIDPQFIFRWIKMQCHSTSHLFTFVYGAIQVGSHQVRNLLDHTSQHSGENGWLAVKHSQELLKRNGWPAPYLRSTPSDVSQSIWISTCSSVRNGSAIIAHYGLSNAKPFIIDLILWLPETNFRLRNTTEPR